MHSSFCYINMRLPALEVLEIQRVICPFLAIIFSVAKSGGSAAMRASAAAAAKPDLLLRGSRRCWRICKYIVLEMRVTPSGRYGPHGPELVSLFQSR